MTLAILFILPHLARLAVSSALARKGRSLFLVLGVAVGTGALAFLLGVHGGLDSLVRRGLEDLRAVVARHEALLGRKERALRTLPVNQVVVRPRTGSGGRERIGTKELSHIRSLPGVRDAEGVAYIFPVTLGIRAEDFAVEIYGQKFPLLEREVTTFLTVYGVPPAYVAPEDLLAGRRFAVPANDRDPVPVVLPAGWLDYLATVKDEGMRERFAELFARRLVEQLKRPRSKRLADELEKTLGPGFLAEGILKAAIGTALEQVLAPLDRDRIPHHFKLFLYPSIEPGGNAIATEIVGFSPRVPGGGVSVPLSYIDRWNQLYADETAGLFGKIFGNEQDTALSEVAVTTTGFEATVAVHEALERYGLKAESAVDDLRPLLADIATSEVEAERLRADAGRDEDLRRALARGTAVVSILLFVLGGAVIANGLALSVVEQQKRIGILRAVGARRVDILLVFELEALLLGALGAAAGLALAAPALRLIGPTLVAGLAGGRAGAGGAGVAAALPADLFAITPATAVAVFGLGLAVSLAAGFFPALRAALVRPVEVLR